MKTDSTTERTPGSLQPDCCALAERPRKRRNIWTWRESRLRRLLWEKRKGWASEMQLNRIAQLEAQIEAHNAAGEQQPPQTTPK